MEDKDRLILALAERVYVQAEILARSALRSAGAKDETDRLRALVGELEREVKTLRMTSDGRI